MTDDDRLERALLRVDKRLGESHANLREIAAEVRALTALLVERGLLDPAAVEVRLAEARAALEAGRFGEGPPVKLLPADDKFTTPNSEVDCAARFPICKGACCAMRVTLSVQDVEEHKLRWDLADPYVLRRDDDGRCTHQDRKTLFCGAYENRPRPCRSYSCADDRRIWRDFDKRIPNAKGIQALLDARAEEPLVLIRHKPTLPPR